MHMVVVAIMGVAIMVVVATMVAVTIMGVATIMGEDLIIMAVTGVGASGSALDGAGLDGVRGGVLHTTRTIRIMRHPLLLLSSNPRRMSSQGNRRKVTGIIAIIQKVTTHMCRGVQTGGRRWRRSRLRLNSDGGYRRMKWARNLVLLLA